MAGLRSICLFPRFRRLLRGAGLFPLLPLLLASAPACALESFVVRDIRVEGIQRTEAGTVFSYLPVKVGETMTEEKAAQAIRALYSTGFFKDVSLEVDNGVLIVTVEERPAIAQIEFAGTKEFDKEQLRNAVKQMGLADGRIFDRAALDKAEQELKRQYVARGLYAAEVKTTVTPLERNRVAINFDVIEGDVAKIRGITIVGAKEFTERRLLDEMVLRTPGWMTWFSKQDQYSRPKLQADLETLRSFYLNRGYLEFNIDSTQVSITPDKKDIYITVGITEGRKYQVADVKFGGELLVPEEELRKLVSLRTGETFSRERLTESTKRISDRLGTEGYAFANVNASPQLDRENQKVSFTFFVDPGRRVYVRRINISGNTRTRDEVIRREMRQLEGGWYNAERIQFSKQRIDKLGYFTDVSLETPSVAGTTDQVDVNIGVSERPTGTILVGGGFSSGEGIVLSGSVSQNNVFGSGNHLTLQLNSSKVNRVYALSFTRPYYTVDGVSLGFDVYQRNTDPGAINIARYRTQTLGGQMRFGVPVTEIDTINYGLGAEATVLSVFPDSPQRFLDFANTFGTHTTTVLATAGWVRDGRDSHIYPTKGRLQRLVLETGLPGGSLRYYKAGYQHQWYYPLSRYYTVMLNGEAGYGKGVGDKPLPFFKNYYAGGPTTVRGYAPSGIGPKDVNENAIGGSRRIIGNAEFLMPFPGLANERSVRVSVFADTGLVGETYQFSDLRYSVGLAVAWVSPLGPLKINYAKPMKNQPGDRTERFQFQFGTTF
jgi:outer membrane protein insertion porin family